MPTITLPNTLTSGAIADATEVMADLNAIVTEYDASVGGLSGEVLSTTEIQTLTNKTLTTPVVASVYQDAAKTKLLTVPNTASDTLAALAATQTLSNKRITKRVGTAASAATHTIDSDSYDLFTITAQAEAFSLANPSGTPTSGQTLVIRIKDNGTARAITWSGTQWRAVGVTLPATTVVSKTLYIGAIWNSTDSKWDVIASVQEV